MIRQLSHMFRQQRRTARRLPRPYDQRGNSGNNYTVTFQNATGAITPLEIHVTADAKTRPYGAVDPPLTYQHTPNLIGSDSFTGGLTREPGTDAGVYLIEQGTLSLSANYTLTYTGANFTITKLDQ